jgi:hypothetical protein
MPPRWSVVQLVEPHAVLLLLLLLLLISLDVSWGDFIEICCMVGTSLQFRQRFYHKASSFQSSMQPEEVVCSRSNTLFVSAAAAEPALQGWQLRVLLLPFCAGSRRFCTAWYYHHL